jgi:hypothetical protein
MSFSVRECYKLYSLAELHSKNKGVYGSEWLTEEALV